MGVLRIKLPPHVKILGLTTNNLYLFTMQFIMGFEKTYLWEDPIHSGIIFGSVLVTLISICYYSLISVVAYCSLTALLAVVSLKVYTYVMVTFLKKETPNPLAKVAAINVSISEDKVNSLANNATTKLNASLVELRRLFLVENMLDSIKFGLSEISGKVTAMIPQAKPAEKTE